MTTQTPPTKVDFRRNCRQNRLGFGGSLPLKQTFVGGVNTLEIAMKTLKVVVKEVNKPANITTLEGTDLLEMVQSVIGGYVQAVRIAPDVSILIDEEGLMKGLGDNCGFVGTLLFMEDVLISPEDGYDWGSLSDENARKALAWCAKHDRDLHPDRSGGFTIITGEQAIKETLEELATDDESKLMEWQSL